MQRIELHQSRFRNRERSFRSFSRSEFPVLENVQKTGSVYHIVFSNPETPVYESTQKADSIIGVGDFLVDYATTEIAYKEAYAKHLVGTSTLQSPTRVILTAGVIDSFYANYRGRRGIPDMFEFNITETHGGLAYTLVEEGEARFGQMDWETKLKDNGRLLRQEERDGVMHLMLRAVGENPVAVVIPDRRHIKFTFVSPREEEKKPTGDFPPFNLKHFQLLLPEKFDSSY